MTETTTQIPFEQVGDLVGMTHAVLDDTPGDMKILVSPAVHKLLNDPDEHDRIIRGLKVVTRTGIKNAEEILR